MSDNVTEMRDHFVYRTYDAAGRLLYIGCTKRLTERWRMHRFERSAMVEATVRCRLQGPYTRTVARQLELEAIRTEEPLHNWTPGRRREWAQETRWIKDRIAELMTNGLPHAVAWPQACNEAARMRASQAAHS